MHWKVRVKVRTYYKGRTPYKVAVITLPREIREVLEKDSIDYVFISTEEPTTAGRNSNYAWALERLARFFEYVLSSGIDQIVLPIAGKKIDSEKAVKFAKASFIKMIREFFGPDFEKMKTILKEVTSK